MAVEAEGPIARGVGLRELATLLGAARLSILAATVAVAAVAAAGSLLAQKTYRATILVAPAESETGGGLGGLGSLAQFAGVASQVGINIGADSKKWESVAVLQSETLTQKYIAEAGLLPILFADKWDEANKSWKVGDPDEVPTLWYGNLRFKREIRRVAVDNKTGLVTMTISWKDPKLAAQWANDLIRLANDYLRTRAIEQSERNIAYLYEQASETSVVEAREAIYSLLQTQINNVMLAKGSDEYAFKVLDPAVPPERPTSPGALFWLCVGGIAGFSVSAFVVLVRAAWSGSGHSGTVPRAV